MGHQNTMNTNNIDTFRIQLEQGKYWPVALLETMANWSIPSEECFGDNLFILFKEKHLIG